MRLEEFVKTHLMADVDYEQYDYDLSDDIEMEEEEYEDGAVVEYIVKYVENYDAPSDVG